MGCLCSKRTRIETIPTATSLTIRITADHAGIATPTAHSHQGLNPLSYRSDLSSPSFSPVPGTSHRSHWSSPSSVPLPGTTLPSYRELEPNKCTHNDADEVVKGNYSRMTQCYRDVIMRMQTELTSELHMACIEQMWRTVMSRKSRRSMIKAVPSVLPKFTSVALAYSAIHTGSVDHVHLCTAATPKQLNESKELLKRVTYSVCPELRLEEHVEFHVLTCKTEAIVLRYRTLKEGQNSVIILTDLEALDVTRCHEVTQALHGARFVAFVWPKGGDKWFSVGSQQQMVSVSHKWEVPPRFIDCEDDGVFVETTDEQEQKPEQVT